MGLIPLYLVEVTTTSQPTQLFMRHLGCAGDPLGVAILHISSATIPSDRRWSPAGHGTRPFIAHFAP